MIKQHRVIQFVDAGFHLEFYVEIDGKVSIERR